MGPQLGCLAEACKLFDKACFGVGAGLGDIHAFEQYKLS